MKNAIRVRIKEEIVNSYFLVTTTEGFQLECLFYGNKKENVIKRLRDINQGDFVELTNWGKYINGIGWYIYIILNKRERLFVFYKNLEQAIETGVMKSLVDLQLEYSILCYQVDKALETRNRKLFLYASKKYNELFILKEMTIHQVANTS